MKAVGIKVLKNRLSEYVKQAAGGEIILVTDRDRVVAELGPPRENRPSLLTDAVLADAARRGLYTPPANPGGIPPAGIPIMTADEMLKGLDEDREDR
ncbi:MAG: prevent-host-death protein [Candidatus Eisenbacteria bacterium]|nr:prevent-host-death protein [Candidatus Eisenbacteria bacterium]